jgi:hypothetical protein
MILVDLVSINRPDNDEKKSQILLIQGVYSFAELVYI